MRERLRLERVEFQLLQPRGVAQRRVVDRHMQDRLRQRLQRLPRADALQEMARRRSQGDRAQMAVAAPGKRIDDRDGNGAPQRLLQRRRER